MTEYPKVVLVTGAGSGIGKATAACLLRSGARVAMLDHDAELLDAACEDFGHPKHDVLPIAGDVASEGDVASAIEDIVTTWGTLDAVVNNAGVVGPQLELSALDSIDFDRIFAVNVRGTWLCMKYAIPGMIAAGGGAIVNVSSALGLRGGPLQAAYSATKHAVIGLTRSAAIEYAAAGIRVNAVCPGVIRTPALMRRVASGDPAVAPLLDAHPAGRFGAPEEVAASIAWLLSSDASYVTGSSISVDGGYVA